MTSSTNPQDRTLIIGQGLAGTVLAFTLLGQGHDVLVVADPQFRMASQVAAGLFNPITGRKFVKTWMADPLFDAFPPYYRQLEQRLDARFFHPMPMFRPFADTAAQNDLSARLSEPDYQRFIQQIYDQPPAETAFAAPHGGVMLHQTGYLDLPAMLDAARARLKAEGRYREARVELDSLQTSQYKVLWEGMTFSRVVFCRGSADATLPPFNSLPFRPSKGEVLTVSSEQYRVPYIVNKKSWLMPRGSDRYRLGATYENHHIDLQPTDAARQTLLQHLANLTHLPFQVEAHEVGIRPATHHRRPYLGVHPEQPRWLLFNGLGAKGVSLAPYFANRMTDFMLRNVPLPAEVDIANIKMSE